MNQHEFVPSSRAVAGLVATLLVGSALAAGCSDSRGGQRAPLSVLSTTPVSGSASVPNDATIVAKFSRAVDPSTLAPAFTLTCASGTALAGSVRYDAAPRTATFTPADRLPSDEDCVARISTAVASAGKASLPQDVTWTFGTAIDASLLASGREIFRHDTFGDESLWTDTLHMNEVIRTAVDPVTALS